MENLEVFVRIERVKINNNNKKIIYFKRGIVCL